MKAYFTLKDLRQTNCKTNCQISCMCVLTISATYSCVSIHNSCYFGPHTYTVSSSISGGDNCISGGDNCISGGDNCISGDEYAEISFIVLLDNM